MQRIKNALRTNEIQQKAVIFFTILNLIAFFTRDTYPLPLLAVCLLFWPLLAFIFNLIDPIPRNRQ